MRRTVLSFLTIALLSGITWRVQAADPATGSADEQSLRTACEGYEKVVNSGDVAAIVKCWTPDADYVNDSGETFKGRPALTKLFKDNLPSLKGKKFSFQTKSLRMIAPGVAVEDGIGSLTGDDDDQSQPVTRYTAVWTRSGNDWLISSVRDLGDLPADEKSAAPLKQLNWMVGDWHSDASEAQVEMSCAPALDGKFLKQKYEVKAKDGQSFSVVTLIGWDPSSGQIHSWFFDSRGGFGDGLWTRDGNSWKITAGGIVSDGRHGSSTNVWKFIDNNTASWQSKDRQLEGIPMPETDVKFVRKTDAGAHASATIDSNSTAAK
jgi:ketosteroid isomerase-like protein